MQTSIKRYVSISCIVIALAAGARAVLSKPLLIDDLFWQIDRLLESGAASPQA